MKQDLIQDMLCDLYDIQNMATLHQFGDLPKDMKVLKLLFLIVLKTVLSI